MTPGNFLKELWSFWGSDDGSAVIWIAPGAESIHARIPEIRAWDADDDAALLAHTAGRNVYTSPGLRRDGLPSEGKGSQGTQSDIIALCGFVLDIDMKGGQHAAENLPLTEEDVDALLAIGPDPTLVVSTGGGLHGWWLFDRPWALPDGHERKRGRAAFRSFQEGYIKRGEELGFHVDNTAKIQHVFRLPGTQNCKRSIPVPVELVYRDGPRYAVRDLVALTEAPVTSLSVVPALPAPELVGDGTPLDQVRAWMRRVHPSHVNRALVDAVLAGTSMAPRGTRDDAMQRAVSTIAWLSPARGLSAEDLAELFRPSLSVWAAEEDAEKSLDEEMDKVIEKLTRAISEREEKDAEERKLLAPIRRFLRLETAPTEPVTEDTISDRGLEQYAIVQYENVFWAQSFGKQQSFVAKPGYYGPFREKALIVQLGYLWEGAPSQFELTYLNSKDAEVAKTVIRIAQEYAVGAHEVIGHFELQESYFDPATRKFHEAVCPIRPIQPEYDEEIATWLKLLGGNMIDRLLDWIAAVTQLRYQCCALYLAGPPSCGKSMLAKALAQIWHEGGATALGPIMTTQFNAEMFKCPLINLDEALPDRSFKNVSGFLRTLVTSTSHSYSQKGIPRHSVVGAIRLLISANNDNVLKFGDEEMSALDLEAFVGRFLHIRVDTKPARWIEEHNEGRRMTERWVEGGAIARHALWLRDNRVLNPGRRYLVEGETTEMHKALVTQGKGSGIVLEWLTRFVTDPLRIEQVYKGKKKLPRAQVGNQRILVNTQGVIDGWDLYLANNADRLSTNMVGRVLNQLSDEHKPKLGTNGERVYFHQVDPDLVFSWARDNQVGDVDRMQENFVRQLEELDESLS